MIQILAKCIRPLTISNSRFIMGEEYIFNCDQILMFDEKPFGADPSRCKEVYSIALWAPDVGSYVYSFYDRRTCEKSKGENESLLCFEDFFSKINPSKS